jgi:hypothetical protein
VLNQTLHYVTGQRGKEAFENSQVPAESDQFWIDKVLSGLAVLLCFVVKL